MSAWRKKNYRETNNVRLLKRREKYLEKKMTWDYPLSAEKLIF